MARLSSPITNLKDHYTVVVVGSGYGGAIAASRMARAGQRVCLLERGKEFQPGEYPNTAASALPELQMDLPARRIGPRTGLYDLRLNEDINVFMGCGLGGGSLVNANVSIRPEGRVFQDARWPREVREDVDGRLTEGYRRAEEMLRPTPYPDHFPPLPKLSALERSAQFMNEPLFYRMSLNVTFQDGVNHVGVEQHACTLCGDCMSGCNYGAKNTTLMNYLPDAVNFGAEVYTQVEVRRLARRDDGKWVVHYQSLGVGREGFDAPEMHLTADIVVLAAGTLGSTEVLLRSREAGLPLSDRLGQSFTGNGDIVGFGYNTDHVINTVGFGPHKPDGRKPVGPTIVGVIDSRNKDVLEDGILIEEGSIAGGLSTVFPHALAAAAAAVGQDTDGGLLDALKEKLRSVVSLLRGGRAGAARRTQVFLVMAHDDGDGRMVLEDDRLRVKWPGVGEQPVFERVNERLRQATAALGGTFIKNPTWTELTNHNVITVHPLGGCVMAEDAAYGVTDHQGRVFAGTSGAEVHEGLYVMDGAVIPRSLGANPLLTISALAERACGLLARDRGWLIDYTLPSRPADRAPDQKLGVRFTERMAGFFSTKITDGYESAAERGKADGSRAEFTVTVVSDDLKTFLEHDDHQARIVGTVTAHALSPQPMTVTEGVFNLFVDDPSRVETKLMRYRMKLASAEGKRYYFEGFKDIHNDPGFDTWEDTTTLFVTVHEGDGPDGTVLGKGILKIAISDFQRQMRTLDVTGAKSVQERLDATARFGRFFSGALFDVYGGVLASSTELGPNGHARVKRPLRMDPPEVYSITTGDGVRLLLTRYKGGTKGPVLLAPGFGTSTLAFTIDTVDTNFPEYLYERGYDVWLLDYRASPELPSSATQFSLDDIATKDWPVAVAKVREVTGADSIQVVAHCVGSMTFLMASAAGLTGVRSAVSSQLTLYPVSPTLNRIRSGLNLASFASVIGLDTITADYDGDDWKDRLFDRIVRFYPTQRGEECRSEVCHRIRFIYGEVYKHDQLNDATHRALEEMFGVANRTTFQQIGRMINAGQVVDRDGNDVYLPNVDKLAFPIAFIHGEENGLFLPEGSEKTYDLLRRTNGDRLYTRHVIKDYAHMDCFVGKNADRDVFPVVLAELEKWN